MVTKETNMCFHFFTTVCQVLEFSTFLEFQKTSTQLQFKHQNLLKQVLHKKGKKLSNYQVFYLLLDFLFCALKMFRGQSAGAVEYTKCIYVEE